MRLLLQNGQHHRCPCLIRHRLEHLAVPLVEMNLLRGVRDVAVAALAATGAESCGCIGTCALAEERMTKAPEAQGVAVKVRGRSTHRSISFIKSFGEACFPIQVCGGDAGVTLRHGRGFGKVRHASNGAVVTGEQVPRDGAAPAPHPNPSRLVLQLQGLLQLLLGRCAGRRALKTACSLDEVAHVDVLIFVFGGNHLATCAGGHRGRPAPGFGLPRCFHIDEGRAQHEFDGFSLRGAVRDPGNILHCS
mmetsp:Transcript_18053/g.39573  ORF Transcript_18053/g.39573 Transcript_18053/m.39573 type:complete len:248 (+) Transcript_18053:67-810(+)